MSKNFIEFYSRMELENTSHHIWIIGIMELPARNNFYLNGLALMNQHRVLVGKTNQI